MNVGEWSLLLFVDGVVERKENVFMIENDYFGVWLFLGDLNLEPYIMYNVW